MPNNTQRVDASNFDYVNCEMVSDTWHTRRGFVEVYTPPADTEIVWATSYIPQLVDSVQTLVLERSLLTGLVNLKCLDEQYGEMWEVESLCGVRPRAVCFNQLDGRTFLTSPDFVTLAGYPGGVLYPAVKGTSLSPLRTTLDIERGISVVWGGRLLIATDDTINIAEPLNPLAFTGIGAIDPPGGSIRGLEVDGSGTLYILTATGTFAVSSSATYTYDVNGDILTVDDHGVQGWNQTCTWGGAVFAVAPGAGVRQVGTGRVMDVNHVTGASGTLSPEPFRAPLHADQSNLSAHAEYGISLRSGLGTWFSLGGTKGSWWIDDAVIEGVISGHLGEPVVYSRSALSVLGGREGVLGGLSGRIVQPPDQGRVCRSVIFSAAAAGVSVTVRTDAKTPSTKTLTDRNRGLPLVWDGGYVSSGSLVSQRYDANERGEEVLVEAAVASGGIRLAEVLAATWTTTGNGRDSP